MDEIIAYKLKFHTPLHIGAHGVGYEETEEILHSDTLFSALMSLWGSFYDDEIEVLCKSSPFIISSAFPFKGATYFFPRPMIRIGKQSDDDLETGKKLKRVKFISLDLLEKMLNGEGERLRFDEVNTFQEGNFWYLDHSASFSGTDRVFSEREIPRVSIDRMTNSSDIFYFSEILFEEDAGLFFLVRFKDAGVRSKFETTLRFLGDEGIGGDKRVGKGLYSIDIEDGFHISVPPKAEAFLNLSLYYPKEEEFCNGILDGASYNLISRKGWIHAPGAMSLRRKEVRMFAEGSIFHCLEKEVYGENPCVLKREDAPGLKHNIYRYGMAFSLPIVMEQAR